MKSFNTQTVAKTSFTKSKVYGLCGTVVLATALLIGAGAVSADETTQPVADTQPAVANVHTADNAGNITVAPSETVAPVETPATVETAPAAEAPATTTEVAQPVAETPVFTPPAPVEAQPIGIPGTPEVRELPEWNGGIPGIPEVRELPPFEGGVVPNDGPILDLPELHVPVEPTKPTPGKPSTPEKAPKTSVERPNNKVAQFTAVSYKLDSEPKEVVNTTVYGGTLPNTGEKEGIMSTLGLVVIAAGITALTLGFKKYNEGEEE